MACEDCEDELRRESELEEVDTLDLLCLVLVCRALFFFLVLEAFGLPGVSGAADADAPDPRICAPKTVAAGFMPGGELAIVPPTEGPEGVVINS